MAITIGINGLGRIGRSIFRIISEHENKDIKIGAINTSRSPEYLAYLLKYDTVHGKFKGTIDFNDDCLIVNGVKVHIFSYRDPSEIPWKNYDVKYVCECTGVFNTKEKAEKHLVNDYGAEYVVLSCPPKDDVPMFVMGANQNTYAGEKIISCASCTTNGLAPLVKIINDKYGVKDALMTTIHSATSSQLTVDGTAKNGKDWRAGRATSGNIIPSSTGAARAVGKIIPELKGKITGMSLRVPTLNVYVVDVTCNLKNPVTEEELYNYIKEISLSDDYKKYIGWTDEPIVSSDMIGDRRSTIVDLKASICLNDKFIKLVSWYDNEIGYSNRMIDLVKHIHENNNFN